MKLQGKYLPIDYEELLFEDLLLLKSSIGEYTNKFHELNIRSHVFETEQQTVAHYKAVLSEGHTKRTPHCLFSKH